MKMFTSALVAITLTSVAVAAPPTIEEIAPENTVLVIGVRDLAGSTERLKNSPLSDFWGMAEEADDDLLDMVPEEMRPALEEAWGDMEGLPTPQGAIGVAIFPVLDAKMGLSRPAIMASADYGRHADAVAARMDRMVEKAKEKAQLLITREKVGEHDLMTIRLPEQPEEEPDLDDLNWGGEQDFDPIGMMMPDPADLFGEVDRVHIGRAGTLMLIGNDRDSIVSALKAVDDMGGRTLADSNTYRSTLAQVGDNDAFAVLLTRDLTSLIGGADPMGMAMMFTPMVKTAFGDIQGFGVGFEIGEGDVLLRQRFSAYMPTGKRGLPALLDEPLKSTAMPDFVGGDVTSFSAMNVRFAGIVPVIRQMIMSNPVAQAQIGQQWMEMQPKLDSVFSALGSEVHMVFGESSSVTSLQLKEPAAFDQQVAPTLAELGMIPGEVDGVRVYSLDPAVAMQAAMMVGQPMEEPMSMALRGDRLLMGSTPDVVAAVKAPPATVPAGSALARARKELPDTPLVAWGFVDTAAAAAMADMPDASAQPVGPTVWYTVSTETGLVWTAEQLTAEKQQAVIGR